VLVGAGTVTTPAQVDRVVEAGAAFVVTPGFRPAVVERCLALGVDVLPGVATAGEIMGALDLGVDVVKLFPAEVLGGVALVDALAGPFPGVRLVPSGGVTAERAPDYLARPSVLAVSRSVS
jgi:2-dehydro-3-deoxyphosphogluconate aldolase/(4S)-4-hydroxy-2-oxoglutarate aldolase